MFGLTSKRKTGCAITEHDMAVACQRARADERRKVLQLVDSLLSQREQFFLSRTHDLCYGKRRNREQELARLVRNLRLEIMDSV